MNKKIDDLIESAWQLRRVDKAESLSLAKQSLSQSNDINYLNGIHMSNCVLYILKIYNNNLDDLENDMISTYNYFEININKLFYSRLCNTIGFYYLITNFFGKAIFYFKKGVAVSVENNYDEMSIYIFFNIGEIYKDLALYGDAIPYFLKAHKINRKKNHEVTNSIISNIAFCYSKIGNGDKANEYLNKITHIPGSTSSKISTANYYEIYGSVMYELGNYREAIQYCIEANSYATSENFAYLQATSGITLAKIHIALDEVNDSIKVGEQSLDIIEKNNISSLLTSVYKVLAIGYFRVCNYEKSSFYSLNYIEADEIKHSENLKKQVSVLTSEMEIQSFQKNAEIQRLQNVELNKKTNELSIINDIGRSLVNSLDINILINVIYNRIKNFTDAPFLAVGTLNQNNLEYISIIADSVNLNGYEINEKNNNHLGLKAISRKETICINDFDNYKDDAITITNSNLKSEFKSLLFCPLTISKKTIGVITIQSSFKNAYSSDIIKLLEGLSSYIAIAINNAYKAKELEETANKLEYTLENLEKTQEQLVHSEKLAKLGELVASIAHEINTPIDTSITLMSYMNKQISELQDRLDKNNLSKSDFSKYITNTTKSLKFISNALNQTSDIINSFKSVSMLESELNLESFNLSKYLLDIKLILNLLLSKNMNLNIKCKSNIVINSYPSILLQILTNFISNSVNHGFKNMDYGNIVIEFSTDDKYIYINYSDNGIGISENIRSNMFEPFKNTNKIEGFIGLGLHSIHNMVTQVLKGNIRLDPIRDKTIFHIRFPKKI